MSLDYKRVDFDLLKVESIDNIKFNNEIPDKVSSYQYNNMRILLMDLFINLECGIDYIDVKKLKKKVKLSENNVNKYLTKLIELGCLDVEVRKDKLKTKEKIEGENGDDSTKEVKN